MYMDIGIRNVSVEIVEDQAQALLRRLELLGNGRGRETVSLGQYRVMSAIHNRGSISVGTLGRIIGSAQSTTSEMVARLTKSGLVTKVRGPDDGRMVLVTLTDQGRQLMRRRKKTLREAYQKLLDSLSVDEKARFVEAVWILNDLLSSAGSD